MSRKPTLKSIWPFGRLKTPGFGIDRCFYMLSYSTQAALPPIRALINPAGEQGSVQGFGVPLDKGTDKSALDQPMARGIYAVSSPDQKTVLRMIVMPRDESGFDPAAALSSPLASGWGPEVANRIRATWMIAQFTVESHDPMVYPALDFIQEVLIRFSSMTDGLVADPITARYLLPNEVRVPDRHRPVDVREHVVVMPMEPVMRTAGMIKFGHPEFQMPDVPTSHHEAAANFLISLAQRSLLGQLAESGSLVGDPARPFMLTPAPSTPRQVPALDLLPQGADGVAAALDAWAK